MQIKSRPPALIAYAVVAYVALVSASLGLAGRAAPEHAVIGGPEQRTAADILEGAQGLFSKSAFDCASRAGAVWQRPAQTVVELWDDYICERGPAHQLFTGADNLTRELAVTDAIHSVRQKFYEGGQVRLEGTYVFNLGEFVSATGDMMTKAKAVEARRGEFSITHFLGSFDYRVARQGSRVHLVVRNLTDRSSGTRIPLRFPNLGYTSTLEGLLAQNPSLARRSFIDVLLDPRYNVVSILEAKTRETTDDARDEGGGVFEQTFEWSERLLPASASSPLAIYQDLLDIR